MKIVRENISFKRGEDPHTSLDIGQITKIKPGVEIELLDKVWAYWPNGTVDSFNYKNRLIFITNKEKKEQGIKKNSNVSLVVGDKLKLSNYGLFTKNNNANIGYEQDLIIDMLKRNPKAWKIVG